MACPNQVIVAFMAWFRERGQVLGRRTSAPPASAGPRRGAIGLGLRLCQGCNLIEHFVVLGEAPYVLLVPDLRAIDVNVENAARPFDQLRLHLELVFDRIRQTGGCGEIISLSTILDGDFHLNNPL